MVAGQVVTVLLMCHTLVPDEQKALSCQICFHYVDVDYSPTPYSGADLFQHGSSQKWFWTSPPDKVRNIVHNLLEPCRFILYAIACTPSWDYVVSIIGEKGGRPKLHYGEN